MNRLRGKPALQIFHYLHTQDSLLPRFAQLVYDLFQLVDLLHLVDDAAYGVLPS